MPARPSPKKSTQLPSSSFELARLRAAIKPFRLHWFPRLRSTNDHAAVLRRRGSLFAPAIVLTGYQTAGRGRGAHSWWSNPGCLTVTFALPLPESNRPQEVPLMAGLAVRSAVADLLGKGNIRLKWPNDILAGERKLAGLLCERVNKADLVGLGLNVNVDPAAAPSDLQHRIASLSHLAGHPLDMTDVLIAITAAMRQMLRRRSEQSFASFVHEYRTHHALTGRRVTVLPDQMNDGAVALTGRCEGIDDTGRLLLRCRDGLHRIISGQIAANIPPARSQPI